jgi:putative phage-type endonuclease
MTAPVLVVGSPEWIAERKTGVFGTDIARILGLSRFGGPMDVFLEKIGQSAPLIETEPMRWGKLLEEPIAQEYAHKSGRKVRRAAAFLRHPVYQHFGANIDRWSLKGGTPKRVLEVKTTSVFTADDFGEEGTDQVPPDYLAQTMWYLAVTGAEQADLAVLIGGNKHRVYEIPRDEELIADMIERAAAFWDDKNHGVPPDIDGSAGSDEYLRKTFRDKGTERPMDSYLASLATSYQGLAELIKEHEAQRKTIGNEIRELMGNDRWAEGEGVKVVYSERAGARRVDWPGLVKAQRIPEALIEEFVTHDDPVRALTVTIKPA